MSALRRVPKPACLVCGRRAIGFLTDLNAPSNEGIKTKHSRMKQLLLKGGGLLVEEVPPPALEPGHVLVRTLFSCVSVGTELAGVAQSSMPIWRRALAERCRVAQVVGMAKSIGVMNTIDFVQNKLGAGRPLGYSLSGRVVRLGEGVHHVAEGDLVACAGAQCANHAEFVAVPKNLVVVRRAASRSATRRRRRSGPSRSKACVAAQPTCWARRSSSSGLGLIGLLTVQILKANGCTVIGADLSGGAHRPGAPARGGLHVLRGAGRRARSSRAHPRPWRGRRHHHRGHQERRGHQHRVPLDPEEGSRRHRRRRRAPRSSGPTSTRKRSTSRISCSYGPGRYDHTYEEAGLDYPLPFVR